MKRGLFGLRVFSGLVSYSAFVLILLTVTSSTVSFASEPVRICHDQAEYPPYLFWQRNEGKIDRSKVVGPVAELLAEIFKIVDLEHSIELIPFKRCEQEVYRFGSTKQYEMFALATAQKSRLEKAWVVGPIFRMSPGILYSTKKYPNGIPFKKMETIIEKGMPGYMVCGLFGNNYGGFGAGAKGIDQGSKDNNALLRKILLGRCDVAYSGIGQYVGGKYVGRSMVDGIGFQVLTSEDSFTNTFYFFVSKSSPRAYELTTKINQALKQLDRSGITDKIYRKYFPECGRWC